MKLKNKTSGFTLLEIIIVIIIVGVLASLALPRLFNTIEYSRSTEALNVIGGLKRGADRCAMALEATTGLADDYDNCDSFVEIGTEHPGFPEVSSSVYTYVIAGFADPDWVVTATRVEGGKGISAADGNTIIFNYATDTGITSRVGTGPYSGLK